MSTAANAPWEAAIASYLHGDRDLSTITALEIGLSQDPRCRVVLCQQLRMHLALTAILGTVDAVVYSTRVQQIIRQESSTGVQRTIDGVIGKLPKRQVRNRRRSATRRPPTRSRFWPLAVAAVLMATIAGWWQIRSSTGAADPPWITVIAGSGEVITAGHTRQVKPGMALRPGDMLRSGPDGVTWEWPADGSRISVAAQAALRIDQQGERRVISLDDGRLLAEVQPPHANLLVITTFGRVVVEGTVFTAEKNRDQLTVAVERGQVRLEHSQGKAISVAAGQSGRVHRTWSQPAYDLDSPLFTAAAVRASAAMNMHLSYVDTAYARFDDVIVPALRELGISTVSDGAVSAEFLHHIATLGQHDIRLIWRLETKAEVTPADQVTFLSQIQPPPLAVMGPFQADRPTNFTYAGLHGTAAIQAYFAETVARMQEDARLRTLAIFQPSASGMQAYDLPASWQRNRECLPGDHMPETALAALPWVPEVLNQAGYHTGRSLPGEPAGVSETAAAIYLPRLWFGALARGIKHVGIYELLDWSVDPDVHWANYGVIRADGTRKPAFHALARLLHILEDSGQPAGQPHSRLPCSLGGDGANLRHLALSWSDGRQGLALWRARSVFDGGTQRNIIVAPTPMTLAFPAQVSDLTVFDLGQDAPLAAATDPLSEYTVSIGAAVVVVTWLPIPTSSR